MGTVTTGAISFDSNNPATTITNIQNALTTAGFTATVTLVSATNPFSFNVTFAAVQSPIQYVGNGVLPEPAMLRDVFRVNSATSNVASQTVWPFDQTAADVQMDIDGDIVTSYEGVGPAVSDNVSIPTDFFESYFALEQQQLTLSDASGLPSSGTFTLQVAPLPAVTVNFGSTAIATANNIQTKLDTQFPGLTVSGTSVAGNTSDIFVVTFPDEANTVEPTIIGTVPAGVTFAASITQQPLNQDLLPFFDPYTSGPLAGLGNLGSGGTLGGALTGTDYNYDNTNTLLYQDLAGAVATSGYTATGVANNVVGDPATLNNGNVDTVIDQVLFDAQYGEGATTEQVGRLRAILENVAGLLRGEASGVLMTQIDANPQDSAPGSGSPSIATYSDDVVSTQRSGQDQRYYITIPWDVQSGSFQLKITFGASTLTTGVIQMPSQTPGSPGFTIDDQTTMNNIAQAVDSLLGTIWPGEGSVNVREVGSDALAALVPTTEVDTRASTVYAIPLATTKAENNVAKLLTGETRTGTDGWYIFELVFQGQAADVPVALSVTNAADQQWVQKKNQAGGTPPPAPTYTPLQVTAGKPVATVGDYEGTQGSDQYDASIAMTSAGSMVSAYTSDANNAQNVFAEPLEESTDTAGPHVVGFTDANGVDLMPNVSGSGGTASSGGTATGVTATHVVLTFDEPMLSDNPVTDQDSVYNAANYQIYNSNGTLMSGVIAQVNYGLSEVAQMSQSLGSAFSTNPDSFIPDNKWEAVLTLNDTANAANGGALPDGTYTLKVLNAIPKTSSNAGQPGLRNSFGTPLNVTGYSPTGSDFTSTITISSSTNPGRSPGAPGLTQTDPVVNHTPGGLQIDPAVASASGSGNYVVVWTSIINGKTNIEGQLYRPSGTTIGQEFQVNSTISTSWSNPDVAMDSEGDFVVTWSGAGPSASAADPSDIFAQLYNAMGQAVGAQFEVDQFSPGAPNQSAVQDMPRIAMSPNGLFIITWTSTPISTPNNTTNTNSSIYAREYDSLNGQLIANPTLEAQGNEFLVSAASPYAQGLSDVAVDSNGDFVIVWESDNNSTWGVYDDYFTYANIQYTASGPSFLSPTPNWNGFSMTGVTDLYATGPRVAMDPVNGAFDVTWADLSTTTSNYAVYAQRFAAGGAPLAGAFMVSEASETLPNGTTIIPGAQLMPAVGVDSAGTFTIVWTSYGQDNAEVGYPTIDDYGIYARIYNADGSDYVSPTTGTKPLEFRVNATTKGNQLAPAVASDNPDHDAVIAWVGPDATLTGATAIYLGNIDPSLTLPAKPNISVADTFVSVGASASAAVFTVSLSASPHSAVTLAYGTGDGSGANAATAKSGAYTVTSGYLYFPANTTALTQTVSVPVAGMTTTGLAPKNFLLYLASAVNGTIVRAPATATISDVLTAAAVPNITVADTSVSVGAAAGAAVFTVSLSASPTNSVTLAYGTGDGSGPNAATAKSGAYTVTSGYLTFPANTTSLTQTVSVPVAGMTTAGPSKNFLLYLGSAVNGTIVRAPATATIVDTLTATVVPNISVADTSVSVGASAADAVFTVSLSASPANTVTLAYGTGDGTAKSASGAYTVTSGYLTFPANTTSLTQTVSVPVAGFTAAGLPNQTVLLFLGSPVNGTIIRAPATATLVDTRPAAVVPNISIADTSVSVGASPAAAVFTVSLSASPTNTVTLAYGTGDGTAKAASGAYTVISGYLTFPANTTSLTQTVSVPVAGFTAAGLPNQTVLLYLGSAVNGTIIRAPATATLVDTRPASVVPNISVADTSVSVGASATAAVFTVSLSASPTNTVTLAYGTGDGTGPYAATGASGAYTITSGYLTFPANTTSLTQTVSVPVAGMTTAGPPENFLLYLGSAVNGTIVRAPATATLVDTLGAVVPTISVAATSSSVSVSNVATAAAFSVSLSASPTNTVTVIYGTGAGNAAPGTAYTPTWGTLTFPANTTSLTQTISVPVAAMQTAGLAPQTFDFAIAAGTSPVNATFGQYIAAVTLVDNVSASTVAPTISVVATSSNVSVSSAATAAAFSVSLSASPTNTVTVIYGTGGGNATPGIAYTAIWGTLTFPANTTSLTQTISVPVAAMKTAGLAPQTFDFAIAAGTSPVNATFGQYTAAVTLVDVLTAAAAPTISVAATPSSVSVGSAATHAVFTVGLSAVPTNTVTVIYGTGGGNATAGSAYTPTWGTLTFKANTTTLTQTVSVPVAAMKTAGLAPQTFDFAIAAGTSPVNATFGQYTAVVTLNDALSPAAIAKAAATPAVTATSASSQASSTTAQTTVNAVTTANTATATPTTTPASPTAPVQAATIGIPPVIDLSNSTYSSNTTSSTSSSLTVLQPAAVDLVLAKRL